MPRLLLVLVAVLMGPMGLMASRAVALEPVVLEGGVGVTFVDLGLDPATGAVTLVGTEEENGDPVAKVFYVAPDRSALTSATLVGLTSEVFAVGISSDGSRITGTSVASGTNFQGTTWQSTEPDMPIGIGFGSSNQFSRNVLIGAWSGGAVGDHTGLSDAISWTPLDGIVPLPDGGGLSQATDVSADGETIVGFASSIIPGGAAPAYWDDSGFHALATSNGNQGLALAVSPGGSFVGGGIGFLEFDPFDGGTQATVWSLVEGTYEIKQLTMSDGSRFKGEVLDITDSSFAVGRGFDEVESGFVWRPGWAEPLDFNAWLAAVTGIELPGPSSSVVAVAEDPARNELWFALENRVIGVTLPPRPGDYDADGDVDTDDHAAWTAAYGQTVPLTTGADGNANGRIDAADYTVWRDAYAATATAVPEPSTLSLLAGPLLALTKRRKPRRHGGHGECLRPRIKRIKAHAFITTRSVSEGNALSSFSLSVLSLAYASGCDFNDTATHSLDSWAISVPPR